MLCREILEGFRNKRGPFAPAPFPRPEIGAGVCASSRRFLVRRFLRRFSADFSSTFWRFENRCSRVTQKCTENLRKNLNGPARGIPHSISAFLSRQHITQSPQGRRTQGEHVRVHCDIFGLKGKQKGICSPKFFKTSLICEKSALRTTSLSDKAFPSRAWRNS